MIQARLFVLGTERELLSTDLECYRTQNAVTGRPGPIPMGGFVTLTFASGFGDDRLLRGLTHSPEGELCTLTAAKIVFYAGDPDGTVLFEYRLKDAAFVYWKEEFNAIGESPMTVTLTISAAIQEIKGITWVKPWRESEVFSEESVAHKESVQRGFSDDRGKKKGDEGAVLGGDKGNKKTDKIGKTSSRVDFSTRARNLDADGGHSWGDHGAHTTEAQHLERLRNGTAPSGRQASPPRSSSKFISDEIHLKSYDEALVKLETEKFNTRGGLKKKVEIKNQPLSNSGISYSLDPNGNLIQTPTHKYTAIFRLNPDNSTYRLVTLFPE